MSSFSLSLKRSISLVILVASSACFFGCRTTIPEKSPELSLSVPVKWEQPAAIVQTETPYGWVSGLGDPALKELVDEAIRRNPDLKLAVARMESSRQLARIAGSERFPTVSLGVESSITEKNGATYDAFRDDQYQLGVGTVWELDMWGKIRNSSAASTTEWEASGFDLQQARHSIAASVSSAWYDLIAARKQLLLAEETAKNYGSTADLIRTRYESGIDSSLDYRLAMANAESAKSSLASRKELYKRSQRSLQILLGRYPDGKLLAETDFPNLEDRVPAGLPSDLLNRRPDVRAAERRLASAEATIRSTSRERLPVIQLTGSTGIQTSEFKNLMDRNFDFWTIGASLNQPLFTAGRLDANFQRSKVVYEQNRALYEQVALRAFYEVEQSLDADQFFAELEQAAAAATEQSVEAEKLAWDQYTSGLINIVTVLEAQRRALNAKQSYIDARNGRIQNRIRLYLSLGGDF
jgi:outer membrane protein, multidrug efflux system